MDENQEALNEQADDNSPAQSPSEEPNLSENESVTETEEQPITEEAATEQPQQSDKRTARDRIRELASERNQYKEKYKSLQEQIAELTGQGDQGYENQEPYRPQYEPGSEITTDQYNQDVYRTADSLVQLRLAQQKHIERVNSEASETISSYEQLNPKSEKFDPELSESISNAALAHMRLNPTASVKKFVDGLMKPYMRSVTKQVEDQAEGLARQVTQSALRPGTSAKGSGELSPEELQELKTKDPTKARRYLESKLQWSE